MKSHLIATPAKSKLSSDQGQRLHGIDALRAIAMILGMLLHASIAYKDRPLPSWPHDISFNFWLFDFIYHIIHSFRMPLFFLIAGYFSRLLYYKLGEWQFIVHRFKRIVIPFFFSLVFILPLTILPFSIYRFNIAYPEQWSLVWQQSVLQIFRWNGIAHLWFLYYLIIYYVIAIAFLRFRKRFMFLQSNPKIISIVNSFHPGTVMGLSFFAALTWLLLLNSRQLYLTVDTGLFPAPLFLGFYGIFFVMGWFINKRPFIFDWISKRFPLFISLGVGLSIPLFIAEFYNYAEHGWQRAGIKLVAAIQIIALVYAVIGFFLRYCHTENHVWKYISDASYWMYLIHLGLIAGLQIFFLNSSIPGILRFPLVLFLQLSISLATYRYLVRYSIIGYYLHGTRKRTKPAFTHELLKTKG